jgi:hypothetical protein
MDEIIQFIATMTDEDKKEVKKIFQPMYYMKYGV